MTGPEGEMEWHLRMSLQKHLQWELPEAENQGTARPNKRHLSVEKKNASYSLEIERMASKLRSTLLSCGSLLCKSDRFI